MTVVDDFLYHFTSRFHLPFILETGYLTLTTSNFNLEKADLFPVVWLTSSQTPENMGLLFDANMPEDLNKTHIRFTIFKEPYMVLWDEWSAKKGMDKKMKQYLINSASAKETYKTWYVSEHTIPLDDVMYIEDMITGYMLYGHGDNETW